MLVMVPPSRRILSDIIGFVEEFDRWGEVAEGLHWIQDFYTIDEWFAHMQTSGGSLTALTYEIKSMRLVGCFSIRPTLSANDVLKGRFSCAYSIRPSLRRRGYGMEQFQLVVDCARTMGMHKLLFGVFHNNIASTQLLQKVGAYPILSSENILVYCSEIRN